MSLKAFVLMAPLALGGLWASGAVGGAAYSRDVNGSPAAVMEALSDLDVRSQPGSPGTDPSASGGVAPLFRTERTANSISFLVLSGDKVATRMTAFLEPLDGGARTRVTAAVERGDAPDDFVSPAFRSEGVTLGLFTMALEGELNSMTAVASKTPAQCQQIMQQLLMANSGGLDPNPDNLRQGIGNGAQTVMRIHAVEAELRRQGCAGIGTEQDFAEIESLMGDPEATGEVRYVPGQPMIDVSRDGR